jgi:hypothetical protein
MAREYTRREPSKREPTTRESTRASVDNTKSVDQRNIERKQRAAERNARRSAESASRAALGGRTLSEALRGTTSTKQRRAIKDAYEGAKTRATDPFAPKSSNNLKPIGAGSLMAQSAIIVVNGFIEEIDMIVGQ